eukprot:7256664-Alexandrium_andersonii.AAC.1
MGGGGYEVLRRRYSNMQTLLQAFETGIARAQKRPQNWSPKPSTGGFCAVSRADYDSADGMG